MMMRKCVFILFVIVCTQSLPADRRPNVQQIALPIKDTHVPNSELETAASSYSHQYADWGGYNPGGYGFSITGFGTIDEKYANSPGHRRFGGYDENSSKNSIYNGFNDIRSYETVGFKGYGMNNLNSGGHITNGYGSNPYGGNQYNPNGLSSIQKEYDLGYYSGNGGYGGFGGNGGLNSYYGYNNPNYIGAGHLGYGYYRGNIYNNGVTPSLVAGYRGYSRR